MLHSVIIIILFFEKNLIENLRIVFLHIHSFGFIGQLNRPLVAPADDVLVTNNEEFTTETDGTLVINSIKQNKKQKSHSTTL